MFNLYPTELVLRMASLRRASQGVTGIEEEGHREVDHRAAKCSQQDNENDLERLMPPWSITNVAHCWRIETLYQGRGLEPKELILGAHRESLLKTPSRRRERSGSCRVSECKPLRRTACRPAQRTMSRVKRSTTRRQKCTPCRRHNTQPTEAV